MKIPWKGDIKLVPTDIPDSAKEDLLKEGPPRWVLLNMDEPFQQSGVTFRFAVLPMKMTPKLELVQWGDGVLCETEAEANESLKLLNEQNKEHIGIVQWAGNGMVGKITKVREFTDELSVLWRLGKDGKKEWFVRLRQLDKATGESTILRLENAQSEAEARRICKQWAEGFSQEKRNVDAGAHPITPPPPARCKPLSETEIKDDLPAAKWVALKRRWPHSFEIFERRKNSPDVEIPIEESQDAYLLDLVEQGHTPCGDKIRGDLKLAQALTKAGNRFAKGKKKKLVDFAIYLIAFNYELGWCYLSDADIAQKISEITKTAFTAEQVEKYRYRTLGLVSKHPPGPPPKYP